MNRIFFVCDSLFTWAPQKANDNKNNKSLTVKGYGFLILVFLHIDPNLINENKNERNLETISDIFDSSSVPPPPAASSFSSFVKILMNPQLSEFQILFAPLTNRSHKAQNQVS